MSILFTAPPNFNGKTSGFCGLIYLYKDRYEVSYGRFGMFLIVNALEEISIKILL